MPLPFQRRDEARFLNSTDTWLDPIGPGFVGRKFLGRGSFGVCGLWEYDAPLDWTKTPPEITQVVVKMTQITENDKRDALGEGIIGKLIATFDAPHLIRQYGGNRLGDEFGDLEDVVKIFLEYCPGGELQQFMPNEGNLWGIRLPEIDLWQIFNCLAKGVYALERRTEKAGAKKVTGRKAEILHHDIKPDNIFFGYRESGDHARFPIAKIADLGDAELVDSFELQDDAEGGKYMNLGAPQMRPPEAIINSPFQNWKTDYPLENPRRGTCSNIWQVGAVMNMIILLRRISFDPSPLPKDHLKRSSFIPTNHRLAILLNSEFNHSVELNTPKITGLYSVELLSLVQHCLMRKPALRPKAPDLVAATQRGLKSLLDLYNDPSSNNKLPPLHHPFDRMPVTTGRNPHEPPSLWQIDFGRGADGRYYRNGPNTPRTRSPGVIAGRVGKSVLKGPGMLYQWAKAKTSSSSSSSASSGSMISSPSTSASPGSKDDEAKWKTADEYLVELMETPPFVMDVDEWTVI